MSLEREYNEWSVKNLGLSTGVWYTPYLKRMGNDLEEFMKMEGYRENFFEYNTYEEYKNIYQSITGESDESIGQIVKGFNKNYPVEIRHTFNKGKKNLAQKQFDEGNRTSPENIGGLASYGTVLRSYLKFLYYHENDTEIYPKARKSKKEKDEKPAEKNKWFYHIGGRDLDWEYLYEKEYIALDRKYLGDLTGYESREIIEETIKIEENVEWNPWGHSLAFWEFANDIKVGDIIYIKTGLNLLLGKGIVESDYYFDEEAEEFAHCINVNWTNKGNWSLKDNVATKTLTKVTEDTDFLSYLYKLIEFGEDDSENYHELFEEWLMTQKDESGLELDSETIKKRLQTINDISNHYDVAIYELLDTGHLKEVEKKVMIDEDRGSYTKNIGNNIIALESYRRFISTLPTTTIGNDPYNKEEFLEEVFISDDKYEEISSILKNKKNIILAGPPGVGKTFIADRLAYSIMGEKDDTRINFVQFHQSYSYEDFIEGFRPTEDEKGFELKPGPFVTFADRAGQDPNRSYFVIIDEINRGNLSKIFGELMMLIENDKRGKSVNLLYSNRPFTVPKNLYIISTMNTADRSLALLDYALRRRFAYIELTPSLTNPTFESHIKDYEDPETMIQAVSKIKNLNKVIEEKLSADFLIGHSYFIDEALRENTKNRLKEVIKYEIIPQIKEYWVDDQTTVDNEVRKLRNFLDDF